MTDPGFSSKIWANPGLVHRFSHWISVPSAAVWLEELLAK